MKVLDFLQKEDIPFHSIALYKEAMTHSSFANESNSHVKDYERLEFMGDAVLQLYVSEFLYKKFPDEPEGSLTTKRSKLVREESLSRFARELGLDKILRLGVGEEKTGGRQRPSILCDIFESFIGALYLDCGEKEVKKMLEKTIYKHVNDVNSYENIKDYKTKLQELIQADERKSVKYKLIESSGPANAPTFKIEVILDEMVLGKGMGTSKKRAEQDAAKDALNKLAKLDSSL